MVTTHVPLVRRLLVLLLLSLCVLIYGQRRGVVRWLLERHVLLILQLVDLVRGVVLHSRVERDPPMSAPAAPALRLAAAASTAVSATSTLLSAASAASSC